MKRRPLAVAHIICIKFGKKKKYLIVLFYIKVLFLHSGKSTDPADDYHGGGEQLSLATKTKQHRKCRYAFRDNNEKINSKAYECSVSDMKCILEYCNIVISISYSNPCSSMKCLHQTVNKMNTFKDFANIFIQINFKACNVVV